jgi:hypothetical protein
VALSKFHRGDHPPGDGVHRARVNARTIHPTEFDLSIGWAGSDNPRARREKSRREKSLDGGCREA